MNEIIIAICKWCIPYLLGAIVTYLTTCLTKNKAVRNGVQSLLRLEIITIYDRSIDKGYAPIYIKETLDKMYKSYHKLGGNDIATTLYTVVMNLPTEKE